MKSRITKAVALLLAIFAAFALTGCQEEGSPASSDTINLGIIQLIENGAFADMRQGFTERMRELGYEEDELNIDYKNAGGDAATLNSICQTMVSGKKDVIVTIATPPTQAIVNMESGIPVFFIAVSSPVQAGVISDMARPDKNATGTSNAIPVEENFKLSDQLTPGCQTYGLVYSAGEINAVRTIEEAKAYMDSVGLSYKEVVVTASSEVQQAAQSLIGSVDAFFIPNDSMVQSALPQLAEVAKDAKIPVYGSSAVMIASGAFATISTDDITIGKMTADMVHEYLSGKSIEEIPAITLSEFTMVINKTTAEAIGAELSDEILQKAVILD